MNWLALVWFVLMVVFLMIEASTVCMVSLWFAAGALVAMVVSLFGTEIWLQVVVFFVVSGVLLALLRPITKKYFTPKLTKTNTDAVIGQIGLVIAAIDNLNSCGRVKLGGMEWTARSNAPEVIPEGTYVTVTRIEGVKVFVSPVKETVTQ